ncbi:MAG TPA: hypothetical protein PKE19_00010 [Aestuariivirga sp.]|nr:hypothetical protein [Aestuariivirga sp.]
MTDNLNLWNCVCRVPKENLKGFTRAGGFGGTAIKPMWSIKTMTEQFGPCGEGWGIDAPTFQIMPGTDGETMVFCTVTVWHGSKECKTPGVGGDRVVGKNRNGMFSDDESFKKAYTDAVTNALKFLGVGADIHMGLWDGSKYVDEGAGAVTANVPAGANGKPAQLLKRDEARQLFRDIQNDLVDCKTEADIQKLISDRNSNLAALGDWRVHVDNLIRDHREFLSTKQENA